MSLLDDARALRLREAGAPAALAVFGLLGAGGIVLAGLVRAGDSLAIDRAILLGLRRPDDLARPIGPVWLLEAARDLTALGGHTVLGLITVAVLTYLLLAGRRHAALLVAVAILGGMALSAVLKLGFDRPRPALVPHEVAVYTASFPSGHAMLSACTYLTLAALLARLQATRPLKAFLIGTGVVLTVAIGLSRIYLGVHWPSDVLAGWCFGGAWACLCWNVALALQRRGAVEPPTTQTPAPVEA